MPVTPDSSYRRQRDLPRLLGRPLTPLPPPGPDHSIRLIRHLSRLAGRHGVWGEARGGAPLFPPPSAARAALEAELSAVRQALQAFADK